MSLGQILLNLEGILKCSGIEDKDTAKIYRDKYQVECHLQNMVKSAKTILSVTGELKRELVLHDYGYFSQVERERMEEEQTATEEWNQALQSLLQDLDKLVDELEDALIPLG